MSGELYDKRKYEFENLVLKIKDYEKYEIFFYEKILNAGLFLVKICIPLYIGFASLKTINNIINVDSIKNMLLLTIIGSIIFIILSFIGLYKILGNKKSVLNIHREFYKTKIELVGIMKKLSELKKEEENFKKNQSNA